MVNIEILILLNLRAVYSLFISFAFNLLRKSISLKEDYKATRAIFSRFQIETTAVFFWTRDYYYFSPCSHTSH